MTSLPTLSKDGRVRRDKILPLTSLKMCHAVTKTPIKENVLFLQKKLRAWRLNKRYDQKF